MKHGGGLELTAIHKEYVTIENGAAMFDYPAKGGVRRVQAVTDPESGLSGPVEPLGSSRIIRCTCRWSSYGRPAFFARLSRVSCGRLCSWRVFRNQDCRDPQRRYLPRAGTLDATWASERRFASVFGIGGARVGLRRQRDAPSSTPRSDAR